MKLSLIVAVLNEEKYIGKLIDSISIQTKIPDEIIIVDGGSSDQTVAKIQNSKFKIQNYKSKFKIIIKPGNRSVGRNTAIKNSTGDIILSTDAGCTLDKNWVKNITAPFATKVHLRGAFSVTSEVAEGLLRGGRVDVVAGYYRGAYKNIFQKSLIPYVLVMEDKIEDDFLPATRSMAFKKSIWKKVGGFDETLSHNEDYAFALKIKESKYKIKFKKDAIVYWYPRKNLIDSFVMFFRFALGDVEANISRPKVIFIFLRYFFALYLIILNFIMKSFPLIIFTVSLLFFYILWSIYKNYRYVKSYKAFFYLPLLQFISDIAVLLGTSLGLIKKFNSKYFLNLIKNNKIAALIIAIYSLIEIIFLSHGIPNINHPFTYFMDEWHQSQAVRNVFQYGTPNIPGSANGSMFHFFLTGLYLIPFYLFGLINPFAIKSSVTQLSIQHNLFLILRLNTLLFGIFSIILMLYIAKKYYRLNTALTAFIFTINPLFIILSGYFKYDIALLFWIILSFLFLLRFSQKPTFINYILAGVFSALSLSTKLSAIPLLPIYLIAFILFYPQLKEWPKFIGSGLLVFLLTFLFFGIPDLVLGRGNIVEYLQSNLIRTPSETSYNYNLGMHYLLFLILKVYPVTFGHIFYFTFFVSIFLFLFYIVKKKIYKSLFSISFRLKNANFIILFLFLLFFISSLYPLKFGATANRVLVLLPFISLATIIFLNEIKILLKKYKLNVLFMVFLVTFIFLQSYEVISWVTIKVYPDPRVKASEWLENNLPRKMIIGLENIPIYQFLPDLVVKEFYLNQYSKARSNRFGYEVINSRSVNLPKTIVLSNDEIEQKYIIKSDKKYLLLRLDKEGYKKIGQFKPDFRYFNILNNELDFYMSGFAIAPNSISVFSKN